VLLALAFDSRSGFTPWRLQGGRVKCSSVENKTWLIEVEVGDCLMAVAIVAFSLMLDHTLFD